MDIVLTLLILTFLITGLGIGLAYLKTRLTDKHTPENDLQETINDLLPGLQCGQCGYVGCRPYAEAIAKGQAPINLCPPGGESLVKVLAKQLGQPLQTIQKPENAPTLSAHQTKAVARIEAPDCIGCTLCLKACPVDAIVGAEGHLHTIVPELCTGCELCIPPCPVDCITMVRVESTLENWEWPWPDPKNSEPTN